MRFIRGGDDERVPGDTPVEGPWEGTGGATLGTRGGERPHGLYGFLLQESALLGTPS